MSSAGVKTSASVPSDQGSDSAWPSIPTSRACGGRDKRGRRGRESWSRELRDNHRELRRRGCCRRGCCRSRCGHPELDSWSAVGPQGVSGDAVPAERIVTIENQCGRGESISHNITITRT
jgi:hypothetical protein